MPTNIVDNQLSWPFEENNNYKLKYKIYTTANYNKNIWDGHTKFASIEILETLLLNTKTLFYSSQIGEYIEL